jgi:hypothetical protein
MAGSADRALPRLSPTGQASGKHHHVWIHPDRELKLYVPEYDLIPDAVGQRILEDAEG